MNYYNYSVAASSVQTEICNNGVLYLMKLFTRCCLKKEIAFLLEYIEVVIGMSVYMSVAERNTCIFLYRYCCEGRYFVCCSL